MMDLTKWLPLFEKCPELQVPYLWFFLHDNVWCLGSAAHKNKVPSGKPMDEDVVAALIRDKATWWLCRVAAIELLKGTVSWKGHSFIGTNWDQRDTQPSDPTEALYLACCHVLEIDP